MGLRACLVAPGDWPGSAAFARLNDTIWAATAHVRVTMSAPGTQRKFLQEQTEETEMGKTQISVASVCSCKILWKLHSSFSAPLRRGAGRAKSRTLPLACLRQVRSGEWAS